MKLHYLEHVPFEDLSNIAVWANSKNIPVSRTRLYAGEQLPSLNAFDMLCIMGGPMNIYEDSTYPWLIAEKVFILEAISAKKKVIGICLGAQLIADVLGGKVTRNIEPEIGWFPVWKALQGNASKLFPMFPSELVAFHWHGDTFSLPPHCVKLAYSEACENQAFSYHDHVVGLQFHLEYSAVSIESMLLNCSCELIECPYVQQQDAILAGLENCNQTYKILAELFDSLAGY